MENSKNFKPEELNILTSIFNSHISQSKMPKIARFRVDNQQNRRLIDSLIERDLIRIVDDAYRITLKCVLQLDTPEAKVLINNCNVLIPILKKQYELQLDSLLNVSDVAIISQHKLQDVQIYMTYLLDLNFTKETSRQNYEINALRLNETILDITILSPFNPKKSIETENLKTKKGIKTIEKWKIVTSLPEGGQAHVYLVRATAGTEETNYVKKVLKNRIRIDRFKKEISALTKINHKHVVKVIEYDLDAEKPYFISEYYSNGSLEEKKFDLTTALDLFDQICMGVQAIHAEGLVHRDLKPQNIFLHADGSAVVGDLGLCYSETDDRITKMNEAVGARWFMAPELEHGRAGEITPAADIYSLGKILHWLLSDGHVVNREDYREDQYNLIKIKNNNLFEHINVLLDKMILRDPRLRLENVEILRSELSKTRLLIEGNYNILNINIPQRCLYCGIGNYNLITNSGTDVNNFGLRNVSGNNLNVLVCEECGNSQIFRMYQSKQKFWIPDHNKPEI